MFWKKGYCHIGGNVYAINFYGASETICGTFSVLLTERENIGPTKHAKQSPGPKTQSVEYKN